MTLPPVRSRLTAYRQTTSEISRAPYGRMVRGIFLRQKRRGQVGYIVFLQKDFCQNGSPRQKIGKKFWRGAKFFSSFLRI